MTPAPRFRVWRQDTIPDVFKGLPPELLRAGSCVSLNWTMKQKDAICLVLVTVPGLKVARSIARAVLEARLAACVNIVPRVESHYWWQGKIESGAELLMILKTTTPKLPQLERIVLANHPYETPEFIAVRINRANKAYSDWLLESVSAPGKSTRNK
ncbi:MAG: divalent-cation tolerance protein CutA [Verrucomicrobiae bacterium]|nr:divalent-cation tolerance protein CutA [Verrucomicrobiae bacterium]